MTVFPLIYWIRHEKLTHSGCEIPDIHLSNSRKFMIAWTSFPLALISTGGPCASKTLTRSSGSGLEVMTAMRGYCLNCEPAGFFASEEGPGVLSSQPFK